MRNGEVTSKDIVFFEDMFQPGMESLPYILHQVEDKHRPTIYLRCLAQAIDPDDFVHVWGMAKWMSLYEQMCNEIPNVKRDLYSRHTTSHKWDLPSSQSKALQRERPRTPSKRIGRWQTNVCSQKQRYTFQATQASHAR